MLSGDAYRFTFVRDPVRRAESAFRDKILNTADEEYRSKVREALGLAPDAPVTLDVFVDALEAQEPLEMDAHWRPQHLNLMHPLITYDHIGRLESFAEDLAHVRETCRLPDVPVAVRNTTGGRGAGPLDERPDLLRRVRKVYARDYELYGYEDGS